MGTRANIKIVSGKNVLWLYKHCDGYPSAVVPDIRHLFQTMMEEKNPHYHWMTYGYKIATAFIVYNTSIEKEWDYRTGEMIIVGKSELWSDYSIDYDQAGDSKWLYTIEIELPMTFMTNDKDVKWTITIEDLIKGTLQRFTLNCDNYKEATAWE